MTKYRIDRIARQRQDQGSSYPLVTWMIVRRDDALVVAECPTKREAERRMAELEEAVR